ncbi:pimeloyl-ACP methyl ester carboxylesterase [Arthrobacter pigmenti]|uniref:Pimeloyl-ACP methyl ester carboxylesterase n=1 Tax=Arthrobacter pigmenti TaxID=271432 RepID=A0A846RRZ8_9MICC|nr:pimeloyl-ACP methyl ester carboxylesterase [Arthrobacter pigmenti]
MRTTTLAYETHGEGIPMVAIHGLGPDRQLMVGCVEPLFTAREGYRRVYVDLPGMGESPSLVGRGGSDEVLEAVLGTVDALLGSEPFLLVGESYGGYIARAVLQRRHSQVLGMALICSIGMAVVNEARTVPAHQALVADPALLEQIGDTGEFHDNAVVQTFETWRRTQHEIVTGMERADQSALNRIRERYELTESPDTGGTFECPILIIAGRQDAVTGYADTYPLLANYPRASFVVLDRAGHNLQIEQPGLFDALMVEWLDRVEEQRSFTE